MDVLAIVGLFVVTSTVALASAGGLVGLVFYAMRVPVARQQRVGKPR